MSKVPNSLNTAPEISVKLNNTNEILKGFTGFQVINAIDAAANAFSFSCPFDPTDINRRRFRPYTAGVVEIKLGDEVFLRGYAEVVSVTSSGNAREVQIQGRSASGAILEWSAGPVWDRDGDAFVHNEHATTVSSSSVWMVGDPTFSVETVFELQGLTAGQIARKIAGAHMIYFEPDTPVISELSITAGQTIHKVLSGIAELNGYFGVPQSDGSLIFRNDLGLTAPVADIIEGESPETVISTNHDATKRFWKYRVIGSTTGVSNITTESTDSKLSPAIRGIKLIKPDQQSTDYQKTADNARATAFIDSYACSVTLSGFAHNLPDGSWEFWKAGDVVRVYAPGAMIYRTTKYIIQRATFQLDENGGQQTALDLGFPEAYRSDYPSEVPWED